MLKKTLPLALGVVVGLYAVIQYYIPHHAVGEFTEDLRDWASILTAAAYALGAVALVQVTLPKVRRREADWQFKVVMLASAAVMLAVGVKWDGCVYTPDKAGSYEVTGPDPAAAARGVAIVRFRAAADVLVQVGGDAPAEGTDPFGKPREVSVPPGKISVKAFREVAGYTPFEAKDIEVTAGQVLVVTADPPVRWGSEGRVFVWLYDHVFAPCNATMFALLAFFVASAAFRAFRARNVEAALLLGAAILILVGRMPMGGALWDGFPDIAQWILDVPNNGSRRAIIMGAAVGAIATSLRVVLGLERSHLGSDA